MLKYDYFQVMIFAFMIIKSAVPCDVIYGPLFGMGFIRLLKWTARGLL